MHAPTTAHSHARTPVDTQRNTTLRELNLGDCGLAGAEAGETVAAIVQVKGHNTPLVGGEGGWVADSKMQHAMGRSSSRL